MSECLKHAGTRICLSCEGERNIKLNTISNKPTNATNRTPNKTMNKTLDNEMPGIKRSNKTSTTTTYNKAYKIEQNTLLEISNKAGVQRRIEH